MEKAKIGLIQFHLSAPKTDMENNVVVSDYAAMDRILREERKFILNLVKQIKKTGCNVLLIQKSILRDAYNDLSLHFLSKVRRTGSPEPLKAPHHIIIRHVEQHLTFRRLLLSQMDIMVVTEVERNDIEFISRTLGCMPVAHIDSFTPDKLGSAELVQEVTVPGGTHKVRGPPAST